MIERRPFGRTNHSSTRAVHWILGMPAVILNTAGDLSLLPRVLHAASRVERRPADEAMAAMLGATRMTSLFGQPT